MRNIIFIGRLLIIIFVLFIFSNCNSKKKIDPASLLLFAGYEVEEDSTTEAENISSGTDVILDQTKYNLNGTFSVSGISTGNFEIYNNGSLVTKFAIDPTTISYPFVVSFLEQSTDSTISVISSGIVTMEDTSLVNFACDIKRYKDDSGTDYNGSSIDLNEYNELNVDCYTNSI